MKHLMHSLFLVLTLTFSSGCSLFGIRREETPNYRVILKKDKIEIRHYQPYIVAETEVMESDYHQAQQKAFRRLAGFNFGKNKRNETLQMTAPVIQSNVSKEKSQRLEMTAPVTQKKTSSGWSMRFLMPSKYELIDLPQPLDTRIHFKKVPEKRVAAIRFTWRTDQDRNEQKFQELKHWIENETEHKITSTYQYAGYDPPWTIPFLRRQEILVEVQKGQLQTQ